MPAVLAIRADQQEGGGGAPKAAERRTGSDFNAQAFANSLGVRDDGTKGIVRAQVENTNLRAYATSSDVTSAESFKTCKTVSFFGQSYVDVVENLNDEKAAPNSTVFASVDMRNRRHRKITFRDVAAFYGYRPCDDARIWLLSPYGQRHLGVNKGYVSTSYSWDGAPWPFGMFWGRSRAHHKKVPEHH